MKKTLGVLFAWFIVVFSVGVTANQYKEGTHYLKLGDAAFKAPNSVVKIYSTNCPYCYKYEKAVMPSFIKNLPEGTAYDSYHIKNKPPFGEEKASVIAVTRVLDENKYKQVKLGYYEQLHDQKKKFSNSDEAINFGLELAGISRDTFDESLNSKAVQTMLTEWENGMEIARRQGVPAIVVNGQYVILTSSIRNMKMLDELAAELLTK